MTSSEKDKLVAVNRKGLKNLPTVLRSEYGREYPIDIIRDAWIKSNQGNIGFARRYGLSESELKEVLIAGEWEKAREKYRDRLYKIMTAERMELVEWRQALLQRVEMYEMIALESTLNDLHDQLEAVGDLFVRDCEGNIVRDACGNPIVRKLAKDLKETLRLSEELRENNAKVLDNARKNELITKGKIKVVNYDADSIFLESSADNDSRSENNEAESDKQAD